MLRPCCYCNLELQKATKIIGIFDVNAGVICFIAMMIGINKYNSTKLILDERKNNNDSVPIQDEFLHKINNQTLAIQKRYKKIKSVSTLIMFKLIMIFFGVQTVMGILLIVGASKKSESICELWMCITWLTWVFTGLIYRIYFMCIVREFVTDLEIKRKAARVPRVHLEYYRREPSTTEIQQFRQFSPFVPSENTQLTMSLFSMTIATPAGSTSSIQAPEYSCVHSSSISTADSSNSEVLPDFEPPPSYEEAVSTSADKNN